MAMASWWICTGLIGKKDADSARLESDCVRYIEKALPPIVETWDYAQWKARVSSEFFISEKPKRVQKDFKTYRAVLGELRGIERPIGQVDEDHRGGVTEIIGYYSARARFEFGSANIVMRLVKRGGGWKFQQFRVRSDALPSAD